MDIGFVTIDMFPNTNPLYILAYNTFLLYFGFCIIKFVVSECRFMVTNMRKLSERRRK